MYPQKLSFRDGASPIFDWKPDPELKHETRLWKSLHQNDSDIWILSSFVLDSNSNLGQALFFSININNKANKVIFYMKCSIDILTYFDWRFNWPLTSFLKHCEFDPFSLKYQVWPKITLCLKFWMLECLCLSIAFLDGPSQHTYCWTEFLLMIQEDATTKCSRPNNALKFWIHTWQRLRNANILTGTSKVNNGCISQLYHAVTVALDWLTQVEWSNKNSILLSDGALISDYVTIFYPINLKPKIVFFCKACLLFSCNLGLQNIFLYPRKQLQNFWYQNISSSNKFW
jgi:hypothetical protein